MIKDQLEKILGFELEATENPAFGDYSSNIAMTTFSKSQNTNSKSQTRSKSPKQLAEEIKAKLDKSVELGKFVDKIEVAGPGFINFWLTRGALVSELEKIQKDGEKYGASQSGKGKTVIIDYSSPNIAKPFGIGHLRSTIIGQALYNLYTALGFTVVGDNHLGDWGTQFGKLLYMIKLKNVTDFSIAKLEELYVEFHKIAEEDKSLEEKAREWFKKLEEGDSEAKSIWQKCVDVSIKEFDKVYGLLGVKIDFAFGESYYESEMGQMMIDPAFKKHLAKGEDGAIIIDLAKEGIPTPLMFLKSDGATTYATRDMATIKFRIRKWSPDIIIYEVGAEQSLHFKQLFAAAKLTELIKKPVELIHTAHGLYLAPDGKKFSTRKGKTIKLEEVLDEAIKRATKLQKDRSEPASAKADSIASATAREVGIGAIKYFDLMHSVQSNVIFEWDKVMNMEGNSGPYLQYTVARTNSVLAKSTNLQIYKSANKRSLASQSPGKQSLAKSEFGKLQMNNEEMAVLRALIHFLEVIESSAKLYSPNILCNFLYDLAQKYNGFYARHRIIDTDNEQFRLALTFGVGQVLKNGLKLLGIQAPERM